MFRQAALAALLTLGLRPLRADTAQVALQVPVDQDSKLDDQAAFLARLLQKGGAVYYRLPAEALPSRDAKGSVAQGSPCRRP